MLNSTRNLLSLAALFGVMAGADAATGTSVGTSASASVSASTKAAASTRASASSTGTNASISNNASASNTDSTADKLTRMETETLLLKARERQLDVRASIQLKENEIAAQRSAGNQQNQAPKQDDPVVLGVEGIGGVTYATLELDDGGLVEVQAGDALSNGMRVLSVAPGNVIVMTAKKKRVRLALQTPSRLAQVQPLPGAALPLPPPMPAVSQSVPAAARGGVR